MEYWIAKYFQIKLVFNDHLTLGIRSTLKSMKIEQTAEMLLKRLKIFDLFSVPLTSQIMTKFILVFIYYCRLLFIAHVHERMGTRWKIEKNSMTSSSFLDGILS